MEWSKIKNIILVILLGVNLTLLWVVGYREYQSYQSGKQAKDSVLAILASNGIAMSEKIWPDPEMMELLQVDGAAVESPEVWRTRAASLLGSIQKESGSASGMRIAYQGSNGTAEFSSAGRFVFELDGADVQERADLEHQGLEILSGLGFDGIFAAAQEQESGALAQIYWQSWEGKPVFNCCAVLSWKRGALIRAEGQQIFGTASVTSSPECLSVPTVLVRFLSGMTKGGYLCSEITAMTAGYEATLTPPFQMTPVWNISTDTGVYYVNAITGEFSCEK